MGSGDGVKKPILQFKVDQADRYEPYDRQISIYCFQLYLQSIFGLVNSVGRLSVMYQ